MHGTSFDWLLWEGGSLTRLDVQHNSCHIAAMAETIRKHAVGWCPGEELLCRPKPGTVGVMFLQDEEFWWTHLTVYEFAAVYSLWIEFKWSFTFYDK